MVNREILGDRVAVQRGSGVIRLCLQSLAIFVVLASHGMRFLHQICILIIATFLCFVLTASRSESLTPFAVWLLRFGIFHVKAHYVLFMACGPIASYFLISVVRGQGDGSLYSSFLHGISDPLAIHFYALETFNHKVYMYGSNAIDYLLKAVPRAVWADKPDAIGYGRFVELNDNTRLAGIFVEGLNNFGYLGVFLFPVLSWMVTVWMLSAMFRMQSLFFLLLSGVLVGKIFTSGRNILLRTGYDLFEAATGAVLAISVFYIILILSGGRSYSIKILTR